MALSLTEIFSYFEKIESTPKRLEMRDHLAALFSQLDAKEAAIVSYMILGRLGPYFLPVEFQIAAKTIEKVIASVTHKEESELRKLTSITGDLGSTLENLLREEGRRNNIENVTTLYEKLWEIAVITGKGSQQIKQEKIASLINELDPLGAKYIVRILSGKLRLGASDKTILDAISSLEDDKAFAKVMRDLSADASDVGHIVYLYKKHGKELTTYTKFTPGIPVAAKLVEREATVEDVFKRIPEPLVEPKYDGLRLQIHVFPTSNINDHLQDRVWFPGYKALLDEKVEDETLFTKPKEELMVRLFSRNLEDMTEMFPEVVDAARKLPEQFKKSMGKEIDTLVLDGEIVGYNAQIEEFLTYQQTMTRRRKHDVQKATESVPVRVFVFDVLWCGDENYMKKPLRERKECLKFLDAEKTQDFFVQTISQKVATPDEAIDILADYMGQGLEGVIIKDEETFYTPGVRNFDWIKMKRDMEHEHKMADTVDLVILGYYYGRGRLARFGMGALLTGVYDKATDQFLTVTKVGTKITDEQRADIVAKLKDYISDTPTSRAIIPNNLVPDVWVKPELVIEIEGFEVTKSPLHSAGYAVRFPKFIKFREKRPEDATTKEELEKLAVL